MRFTFINISFQFNECSSERNNIPLEKKNSYFTCKNGNSAGNYES